MKKPSFWDQRHPWGRAAVLGLLLVVAAYYSHTVGGPQTVRIQDYLKEPLRYSDRPVYFFAQVAETGERSIIADVRGGTVQVLGEFPKLPPGTYLRILARVKPDGRLSLTSFRLTRSRRTKLLVSALGLALAATLFFRRYRLSPAKGALLVPRGGAGCPT